MAAQIESISTHSHNCSLDQETREGSLCDEVNRQLRQGTDGGTQSFIRKLSDISVDDKPKELSDEMIPDTWESQTDGSMDDGSKENSAEFNVSTFFMAKTSGGDEGAVDGSKSYQEENANLQLLREKLTAALFNVSVKDDLVKQHSKVAEEAVAGWEKAEKEAIALKQELDAVVESKSAVEAG